MIGWHVSLDAFHSFAVQLDPLKTAPPAATFVPADGPGAWLMSVLPVKPAEGAEGSESGTRTENPSDGDQHRGF